MNQNRRVAAITVAFFVAGIFCALAVSTEAAGKDQNILLTLRVDVTGRTIVKVQPRDAKLWRNDPDRPQQVRWWMVNSTLYDEIHFEIRYDPSRASDGVDYFGDVDIECDQTEVTVTPSTVPDTEGASWPYVVTVYGCVDGQKAQELETINPKIIWKD